MACNHDKRYGDTFGAKNGCVACQAELEALNKRDAQECARWLLPFLVNEPHHLKTALERWPWLQRIEL
jgi:hypothetical protein